MASSTSDCEAEKPKTDNFYSPANFAFYAEGPYQPLPSVPYHIRLLNVSWDADNNNLHCELTDGVPLREASAMYTAISYCAGDPKNTRELIVDGVPFNAFANLVQAIEETCRYLPGGGREKVSVWADQICINQSDPQERAEQVSVMYEIYQSAYKVTVCLTTYDFAKSVVDRESDRAIRCIEQVYKDVPQLDRFLASSANSNTKTWENGWGKKESVNCLLNNYLQNAVKDRDFVLGWFDVLRMRRMPWFSRAWVLQEYASHQDVVFLYAWKHIESKRLAAVLLGYLWSGDLPSTVEGKIAQVHVIDAASLQDESDGKLVWSVNSPWLTMQSYDQKVYNALRSKSYVSQERQALIDLLDHSRMSIASDKRDHVFSCLGLAKRSYGIQPYYKDDLSFETLFTYAMGLLLLCTKDISLIERASTALGDHAETLPSWVPDWSQPITRDDAEYYQGRYNNNQHAGGHTEAHIEFLDRGKVLETKGVLVETLVGETKPEVWSGERVGHIQTYGNPQEASPSPFAHVSSNSPAKGDEVWILYGSAHPFLLRKVDDYYVFLRSVHIYCIDNMEIENGTFIEFGADLETETRTLRIH